MSYIPFDFIRTTRLIVVFEEKLREAEKKANEEQIKTIDVK